MSGDGVPVEDQKPEDAPADAFMSWLAGRLDDIDEALADLKRDDGEYLQQISNAYQKGLEAGRAAVTAELLARLGGHDGNRTINQYFSHGVRIVNRGPDGACLDCGAPIEAEHDPACPALVVRR